MKNMSARIRAHHYSKTYLKTIILLITMTIIVFIIGTSYSIYSYVSNTIVQNKYQVDKQMLFQIKYNVEKQNQIIRNLCMGLFYNPDVVSIVNENLSQNDLSDVITKINKIETTTFSLNPFIQSIYFYNNNTKNYYSTYYGYGTVVKDEYLQRIMDDNVNLPVLKPIYRKIKVPSSKGDTTESVFSYIMCDNFSSYNKMNSSVIFNIKMEYFFDEIKAVAMSNKQPGDNIMLVTEDGSILQDKDSKICSAFEKDLIRVFNSSIMSLDKAGTKLGSITEKLNGEKYFISFICIEGTDIVILKTQPFEAVFSNMKETETRIVIITLIAILMSIFTSIYLSKRIYKPINKLIKIVNEQKPLESINGQDNEIEYLSHIYVNTLQKLDAIKKEKYKEDSILKQVFLNRLAKNNVTSEDIKRAREMKLVGFDIERPMFLWVLRIDNYGKFLEFSNQEYNLHKFAIANIMSEVITNYYDNEFFEVENDRFAVILNVPNTDFATLDLYEKFSNIIKEGQMALLQHFGVYISAALSHKIECYKDIAGQYIVTNNNLKYTFINAKMCIINPLMVAENNNYKDFNYPFEIEGALIAAINNGKMREVEVNLDIFLISIKKMNYDNIVISIMRLYNIFYDTLIEIYNNNFIPVSESLEIISSNIFEQENLADIRNKILSEVKKAFEAIKDDSNTNKRNAMLKTIANLIEKNYNDPNLCLSSIAEKLNKAPNYIGTIYKNSSNKSIADSILEMRMKKSEELLMTTDYSTQQIMEAVGILSESSFYKNFKKFYGATPNNYKLSNKVMKELSS